MILTLTPEYTSAKTMFDEIILYLIPWKILLLPFSKPRVLAFCVPSSSCSPLLPVLSTLLLLLLLPVLLLPSLLLLLLLYRFDISKPCSITDQIHQDIN